MLDVSISQVSSVGLHFVFNILLFSVGCCFIAFFGVCSGDFRF